MMALSRKSRSDFRCRACIYWFPNPFWPPQSGHCQVMPLQDMPHTFSCMHSWQIRKPQRQRQQKGTSFAQQWQIWEPFRRRRDRRTGRVAVSFIAYRKRLKSCRLRWLMLPCIANMVETTLTNAGVTLCQRKLSWTGKRKPDAVPDRRQRIHLPGLPCGAGAVQQQRPAHQCHLRVYAHADQADAGPFPWLCGHVFRCQRAHLSAMSAMPNTRPTGRPCPMTWSAAALDPQGHRGVQYSRVRNAGYEADDLIGTLAHRAEKSGFRVVMVTGDKDFMQLVTDAVSSGIP
jgi:hypothetical protein